MDRASLIDEVRNYLQKKRYVVVFDDVWSLHFWDDIEFALIDNKNRSKILITTRKQDVIVSCKRSSFVEMLPLESLTQEFDFITNYALVVWLQKLPEWIPELQNLVVLTKDPMESLKCLQQLLILDLRWEAYEGLHLHVEAGAFQKLYELHLASLEELQDIIIDKGALPSLKNLDLFAHIPTGIKHLEKLEALHIYHMHVEFVEHNSTEVWIMEHVPVFRIQTRDGNVSRNPRK